MPLYPDLPQGVLTPGFGDFGTPLDQALAARQRPTFLDGTPDLAAPFDTSNIAAALGITAAPEAKTKRPGLMGRIRQQPGGSKALIAMGASLLSNPNFFEGLGQGALAYQGVLDEEQQKLLPTPNKDGTFTTRRDPNTGELIYARTPVADFDEHIQDMKLKAAFAQAKMRDEGDTERLETTMGFRDKWEAGDRELKDKELDYRDTWNKRDNETDLEIARINGEEAYRRAVEAQGGKAGKPPPVSIQKQVSDFTQTRDAQDNAIFQIEPILGAIERGDLSFSLPSNLRHKAAIATGVGGNEETVFFSQYQTTLESLRNALLVANKGVQTDGDAERAMAELIAGSGNTETVKANLTKVLTSLRRRQAQAQNRINELARQYGVDTGDSSPQASAAPAATTRRTGSSNGVRWRVVN